MKRASKLVRPHLAESHIKSTLVLRIDFLFNQPRQSAVLSLAHTVIFFSNCLNSYLIVDSVETGSK